MHCGKCGIISIRMSKKLKKPKRKVLPMSGNGSVGSKENTNLLTEGSPVIDRRPLRLSGLLYSHFHYFLYCTWKAPLCVQTPTVSMTCPVGPRSTIYL